MYEGARVLVTGGTGLIGSQLVALLRQRSAQVRVAALDDPWQADGEVEYLRGDLTDPGFCKRAVSGMNLVFHVAGIKGSVGIGQSGAASFFVPHLLFNTQLLEAARQAGVERLLYTSSMAVYPSAPLYVEDEAWSGPPHPGDTFPGWAKRMGELQAEAYRLQYGWDKIAIVRPTNVYGPGDNFDPKTAMVVPALLRRVLDGEDPLVVWGDGSAVRDFLFSRDAAEGMLLALEKGANCTPINLGSGRPTSIKELVTVMTGLVDSPPRVEWDLSKPAGEPRRVMDVTRAEQMLGFRAGTTLEAGLRETVQWVRENRQRLDERYNVFRRSGVDL